MSRVLGLLMTLMLAYGCANARVKMVDDQTFLSVKDPNLQIEVAPDYVLKKDAARRYRFEFFNEEERRYVLIHYLQRPVHTSNIDYFNNPATWIFYDLPDCEDIEKGDFQLFDHKWYFRDYVYHQSTSSCALIREMGHFARNYAVLKVLYWQDLPPYKCSTWKGMSRLNAEQQERRNRFLTTHQEDIKMSSYEQP